ncbi:cyclophilin-like fold protein [Companilactobacillus nodensis]|nr:cyclophilin-like fold protein [Companilactobacillus nodensis]
MKKHIVIMVTSIMFVLVLLSLTSVQSVSAATDKIRVTINNKSFKAKLYNNSATKSFKKRLPMKLKFRDYASEEKIADISGHLNTKGMADGGNPKPGQIAYWSPQPRIVFYYSDVDYFDGIHLIGKFDQPQKASRYIQKQHGKIKVVIQKSK